MRLKLGALLTLSVGVCWVANVCRAQTSPPRVARAEALKAVKVASLDGWRESVSDAGRFRILFRGEPEAVDEPTGRLEQTEPGVAGVAEGVRKALVTGWEGAANDIVAQILPRMF